MIQMEVMIAELVTNLEFAIPDDPLDIQNTFVTGSTLPLIRKELDKGPQMPLKIRALA
jgi:hypothetical protein